MSGLQHPFPTIEYKGSLSIGGNQSWMSRRIWREWGCGLVSGLDLLWYISMYRNDPDGFHKLPEAGCTCQEYLSGAEWLGRKYLPVLPKLGVPGPVLAAGLNRLFRKQRLGLKACWGVRRRGFWNRIEEMLACDLPIILGIGPNLPLFWRKKKLALYRKCQRGYEAVRQIRGHYVMVTAMDEEWLQVLSWGKRFMICREELEDYFRYSGSLFSNIVYIVVERKRRRF